ncbi:MAG TPA: hypothetical protein VFS70_14600 [Actinomycetota bacterium]|nr:hypothetical protein [Actinomycetota bacterium]
MQLTVTSFPSTTLQDPRWANSKVLGATSPPLSGSTPSGVTISVYRPTGRPELGSVEMT